MSSSAFPVPVQMELPSDDWSRVEPAAFSSESVGMLAVRSVMRGEYVPTLAVDGGVRPGDLSLEEIADDLLHSVRDQFDHAELIKRRPSGTDNLPALLQLIGIEEQRNGRRFDLQQVQVIQSIRSGTSGRHQIILTYTMISEFRRSQQLRDEFSTFMESVVVLPEVGSSDS